MKAKLIKLQVPLLSGLLFITPFTFAAENETITNEATPTNEVYHTTNITEVAPIQSDSVEIVTIEEPSSEVLDNEKQSELPTKDEPTTTEQTIERPTIEVPPTTEPPTTAPPTTVPPTTEPPTNNPTTELPSTDAPSIEVPSTERPETDSPTTEIPGSQNPELEQNLESTSETGPILGQPESPQESTPAMGNMDTGYPHNNLGQFEPLNSQTYYTSLDNKVSELLTTKVDDVETIKKKLAKKKEAKKKKELPKTGEYNNLALFTSMSFLIGALLIWRSKKLN